MEQWQPGCFVRHRGVPRGTSATRRARTPGITASDLSWALLCTTLFDTPIAAEPRNPREVSPSATILLDPPETAGWFVPAATPTSNSIATGFRGKQSPLATARRPMRNDRLRPPQHSMRRAARSDQRTRRRCLSGASLERTSRATRAVRSGIGRWPTPPEDPHGSGNEGDRACRPGAGRRHAWPGRIPLAERAGGNRIPAPMALAISMLAIGDCSHAASTRASEEGRDVLAQASFPIPGLRSDVPELQRRLARRAVTTA